MKKIISLVFFVSLLFLTVTPIKAVDTYGPNLIKNGDFESGYSGWREALLNRYDYDNYLANPYFGNVSDSPVIKTDGGNSYAYMTGYSLLNVYKALLGSNTFEIPNNIHEFKLSYDYKYDQTGTCSNYNNNVLVLFLVYDETDKKIINGGSGGIVTNTKTVNGYVKSNYTITDTANGSDPKKTLIPGHKASLNLMFQLQSEANCIYQLSIDNLSIQQVFSSEYRIGASTGSNGSIVSNGATSFFGSTTYYSNIPGGSEHTFNMTPKSGYEIADVVVDGVSVGPIKSYTFKNISTDHQITATFQTANTSSQRIYRFWSNRGQHHFYTANDNELTNVVNNYSTNVWKYEKAAYNAFTTQQTNTIPLYRFWSDNYQGHFYTSNETEKNKIIASNPNWRYEQIAYYVYGSGYTGPSTPVYRFWSDNYRGHFYTSNETEMNNVKNNNPNWRYEGVAFKVAN